MRPPGAAGSRSRTRGTLTPTAPIPGLALPFGQIAVADNPAPAPDVGQIRMGRDRGLDFRFNRLGKQLPGSSAQDIRQRIIGK